MHSSSSNPGKKLFLLDAYALIYRSYYAFIRTPRFTSKGLNTSAILGFTNTLLEILEKEKPSHIAVVFDPEGPTFRHEMYTEYKANRHAMPEDLKKSIPYIKEIIRAFNIPEINVPGYEADDVIGTLAKKAEPQGYTVYMMTPDKDYAQLVSENIFMYKPKRSGKEAEVWGIPEVQENFGIKTPGQVVDILGLMGDASDNIPGCPGIGPKTAQKLIAAYGSIEELYKNTDKLQGKQKLQVVESEEQVKFSKVLAKIATDAPINFNEKELKISGINDSLLKPLFRELEFISLADRVFTRYGNKQTEKPALQPSLFPSADKTSPEQNAEEDNKKIPEGLNLTKCKFHIIDNPDLLADLKADLCIQKEFAFKTVLSSSDPNTSHLLGFAFCFKKTQAFFVSLPQNFEAAKKIAHQFRYIFEDENIIKISHNSKRDLLALKWYGIELHGPFFDTMIAHYLIQPGLKHELSYIARQYLGYELSTTGNNDGKSKAQLSFALNDEDQLRDSACKETIVNLHLKELLKPEMESNGTLKLFEDIEMPLVEVLAGMEFSGVRINVDTLREYAIELNKQANVLEKEIIDIAGVEFNVSSPKQLGEVLFEKMEIDSKAQKTKSGQYSTSESVLLKLKSKHDIIQKILDFRSLKKLISTYVEALPGYINSRSGKIHTSFNQAEAVTGRLSSTNPNLQNIPIRTEQGRYIRKAFIPTDETHIFLSADYSQVELRLMAHMSGDAQMIEAFNQNADIHTATAAKIYKIQPEDVSREMRDRAKTANFGIIYGISAWGLAERLNISRSEGKELITGYFESYPEVKAFMDGQIAKAREKEFVETIMGRRRYLNDINSANAIVRGIAERNAINAPIQGSAADIIKLAMIRVFRRMKKEELKSRMILQVHDELNFDCLKSELSQMQTILREEMENVLELSVPLTIDTGTGANWLEAH